jgi:hypothetical protein
MRHCTFLCTIVLVGISTAACGADTSGLFGNTTSGVTSGTGGGGTGGSGGMSSTSTFVASSSATTTSSGMGGSGTGGQGGATTASSSGQGGMATSSSSSGQGGGPTVDPIGCSDGTREYFADMASQPNIAGCSGGWSIVGVTTPGSMQPACNRVSGNDSSNPNGMGCSVEDLCAAGWYVCHGAGDVGAHSSNGQCEPSTGTTQTFWLTRQVQDDQGFCSAPPDTNNITGCGNLGGTPIGGCDPLVVRMRNYDCIPTQFWACGTTQTGGTTEANIVRKDGPGEGGVLCCKQ